MSNDLSRRHILGVAAAAVAAGVATNASGQDAGEKGKAIKIVGVCCSPRKGKTTAAALQVALDAARAVNPAIEVELVELAGMKIDGNLAVVPAEPGQEDDFPKVAEKLGDPRVAGIIVGTPVYFGNMSSLCKAFLDRCMFFRKTFGLSGKVGGALAVGGVRNGGQELTVQSVIASLLCQEMVIVGDGRPTAHQGATLLNTKDDISGDEFGQGTAKNLGRRVAEIAIRLAKA